MKTCFGRKNPFTFANEIFLDKLKRLVGTNKPLNRLVRNYFQFKNSFSTVSSLQAIKIINVTFGFNAVLGEIDGAIKILSLLPIPTHDLAHRRRI